MRLIHFITCHVNTMVLILSTIFWWKICIKYYDFHDFFYGYEKGGCSGALYIMCNTRARILLCITQVYIYCNTVYPHTQ